MNHLVDKELKFQPFCVGQNMEQLSHQELVKSLDALVLKPEIHDIGEDDKYDQDGQGILIEDIFQHYLVQNGVVHLPLLQRPFSPPSDNRGYEKETVQGFFQEEHSNEDYYQNEYDHVYQNHHDSLESSGHETPEPESFFSLYNLSEG